MRVAKIPLQLQWLIGHGERDILGQIRDLLRNILDDKIICVRMLFDDVLLLTDEKTLDYVLCVAGNGVSVTDYMEGLLK